MNSSGGVKRRSSTPTAVVERRLDRAWSKYVKALWMGRCAICGSVEGTSAHHLVKRRFKATRHHPLNGVLLCMTHHREAEEHQDKFTSSFLRRYPCYTPIMEELKHERCITPYRAQLSFAGSRLKDATKRVAERWSGTQRGIVYGRT